jgi:hypothetical protein
MFAGAAILGAGLWAANEYGYINLSSATGNLPLPMLVSHKLSRIPGGAAASNVRQYHC